MMLSARPLATSIRRGAISIAEMALGAAGVGAYDMEAVREMSLAVTYRVIAKRSKLYWRA